MYELTSNDLLHCLYSLIERSCCAAVVVRSVSDIQHPAVSALHSLGNKHKLALKLLCAGIAGSVPEMQSYQRRRHLIGKQMLHSICRLHFQTFLPMLRLASDTRELLYRPKA